MLLIDDLCALSAGSMDETDSLYDCKNCFPERVDVRLHHGPDYPLPDSISKGIVFVIAHWSGQAKISRERLTRALTSVRLDGCEIHFLNTDNLDDKFRSDYRNPQMGGYGETFWIKDGKILFADLGYHKENGELLMTDRVKQFFAVYLFLRRWFFDDLTTHLS